MLYERESWENVVEKQKGMCYNYVDFIMGTYVTISEEERTEA